MPIGQLEHVNITVNDPERSSELLQKLCGWHERWRGKSQMGGWTIHVGNAQNYVAVYSNELTHDRYMKGQPLNHIGLVVDDLGSAEAVVIAAGLLPFGHGDYEPGRRFYFFDWEGIEFEVVSYAASSI